MASCRSADTAGDRYAEYTAEGLPDYGEISPGGGCSNASGVGGVGVVGIGARLIIVGLSESVRQVLCRGGRHYAGQEGGTSRPLTRGDSSRESLIR